jgi:hypothetical protein
MRLVFRIPERGGTMKRITRAALALVLACGLCVQLSAQSATGRPNPIHGRHPELAAQAGGNPPARVRQPGSKTRMIVAIVAVASLVTLGVFHGRN